MSSDFEDKLTVGNNTYCWNDDLEAYSYCPTTSENPSNNCKNQILQYEIEVGRAFFRATGWSKKALAFNF